MMDEDSPSRLDPQCLEVLKQNNFKAVQEGADKAQAAVVGR